MPIYAAPHPPNLRPVDHVGDNYENSAAQKTSLSDADAHTESVFEDAIECDIMDIYRHIYIYI